MQRGKRATMPTQPDSYGDPRPKRGAGWRFAVTLLAMGIYVLMTVAIFAPPSLLPLSGTFILKVDEPIEVGIQRKDAVDIWGQIDAPNLVHNTGPQIHIRNMTYYISEDPLPLGTTEVCLTSLRFDLGPESNTETMQAFHPNECHGVEYLDSEFPLLSFGSSTTDWLLNFDAGNPHFWYPYDDSRLQLRVKVSLSFIRAGAVAVSKELLAPGIHLKAPRTLEWQMKVQGQPIAANLQNSLGYSLPALDPQEGFVIEYKRPLLIRLMYPAMLLVPLLFIVLLSLVDSLDTFIQGGVGVFFGVWAIRSILLPPSTSIPTILDYAIWGLYFVFAVTMLSHIVPLLIRRRSAPAPPTAEVAGEQVEAPAGSGLEEAATFSSRKRPAGITWLTIGGLALVAAWLWSRINGRRA